MARIQERYMMLVRGRLPTTLTAPVSPSLPVIYPLVLKKTCFTKKFILEPGHRKLFFNQSCHLYFLCFLNLSGVELCVQQVQHGQNVVFPFAVACRFLDLFQCCTNCAYPLYFRGSLTFISAARGDSSLGNLDSRSFCRGSFAMFQGFTHTHTRIGCCVLRSSGGIPSNI